MFERKEMISRNGKPYLAWTLGQVIVGGQATNVVAFTGLKGSVRAAAYNLQQSPTRHRSLISSLRRGMTYTRVQGGIQVTVSCAVHSPAHEQPREFELTRTVKSVRDFDLVVAEAATAVARMLARSVYLNTKRRQQEEPSAGEASESETEELPTF